MMMIREYTKQVMHSTIAHKLLTDAQPLPKLWPSLANYYTLSMMSYGLEYPFGQSGSAVLAVPSPSSLCTSCVRLMPPRWQCLGS